MHSLNCKRCLMLAEYDQPPFTRGSQTETLLRFESELGIGAVAAARKLDTPYDTYKDWKSGRHKMPGCAYTAINLWIAIES